MSAPENVDTRARLLGYARWAAIGLASLAALIIAAFSGAAALRIAAFMAVIAVVLVVLSITLNGASSTKLHLEETLLDEIDMLREDVRADITTAARATHRALAERVAHLHENVEQVRRQVGRAGAGDAARPVRRSARHRRARRAIGGAGVPVVHTETVHVTTQTYVDPVDDPRAAGFVRPTTRRPERDDFAEPMRGDRGRARHGPRRHGPRRQGRARFRPRRHRPWRRSRVDPAARPATTAGATAVEPTTVPTASAAASRTRSRSPLDAVATMTVPDGMTGPSPIVTVDRPGDRDRGDSPSAGRRPSRDPREDSWAEQRMRDLVAPHVSDPPDDAVERGWRAGRDDDPGDDDRVVGDALRRSVGRGPHRRTRPRAAHGRASHRASAPTRPARRCASSTGGRRSGRKTSRTPTATNPGPTRFRRRSPRRVRRGWVGDSPADDASVATRRSAAAPTTRGETRSERRRREEAERGRPALPASGPESAAGLGSRSLPMTAAPTAVTTGSTSHSRRDRARRSSRAERSRVAGHLR